MIADGSRYATCAIVSLPDRNGVPQATVISNVPQEKRLRYTSYMIVQGDRIDALAYDKLGDPTLWWMIADANPEILNWDDLIVGTVIRVPYAG